jgi:hypothetical protein
MRVRLEEIAHARSGDKGDASNVGLIAGTPELYEVLREQVTAERVKEHFRQVCRGKVERFELPTSWRSTSCSTTLSAAAAPRA